MNKLRCPNWLEDRYDVDAKAGRKYSVDDLNTIYQNLLADRFRLKFHNRNKRSKRLRPHHRQKWQQMKVNDQPQSGLRRGTKEVEGVTGGCFGSRSRMDSVSAQTGDRSFGDAIRKLVTILKFVALRRIRMVLHLRA
jgi:uncharacterized protein (TIGR03435 family)